MSGVYRTRERMEVISYCVSAALARVEAQETFAALLRRFPRMQVAPGGARGRHSTTVGCRAGVQPDRECHPAPSD
ncbi:hypothetical protein [Archangium sp.]|uniref:hypothetical protein n=1 Tax=Archangium sp. TaxID=1872627 RepID=UPI00286C98B6|nr:hypothetical protein [Archangium sp.]